MFAPVSPTSASLEKLLNIGNAKKEFFARIPNCKKLKVMMLNCAAWPRYYIVRLIQLNGANLCKLRAANAVMGERMARSLLDKRGQRELCNNDCESSGRDKGKASAITRVFASPPLAKVEPNKIALSRRY